MFVNSKGATIINECLSSDGKRINLPNHVFEETYVAIDIGGSLAKVVYYDKSPNSNDSNTLKEGHLNFAKFPTDELDEMIKFLKTLFPLTGKTSTEVPTIVATGGGAHLFQERLELELNVKIQKEDEMFCLIKGVDFFIREVPLEVFTYSLQEPMNFFKPPKNQYPYLLVNIGSGVSIIKVKGENDYERISGTSLGGGTFWGLLSLLTDCTSFDEMLELSKQGHNTNVDLLVGDIYGTDYNKIGLKSTTIASSMGKVFRKNLISNKPSQTHQPNSEQMLTPEMEEDPNFKPQDICASLLYMVSNNIGQIAYLNAKAHNIQYIYFGGFFIRGHPITMNTLSYAINFWSKGNMKALFLRHEGYLGAMGAFLKFNEN